MKKMILVVATCFAMNTFGQLPNHLPTSGQVSIGTAVPTAGKQLTVSGLTIFNDNVEIDADLRVTGQTLMEGIVRMQTLVDYTGLPADLKILVTDSTGNITRTPITELYAAMLTPAGLDNCTGGVGDIDDPKWYNGTNKLYSPCPQVKVGIGTDDPTHQLTVPIGSTFIRQFLAGNGLGSTTATINGFTPNNTDKIVQLGTKIGALDEEVRFVINNDGSVELTNTGTSAAITINNGSGHAFVVKDNGGNKIAQLHNNGLLRSRSIRVDLATWADHVFDKDYSLLPLKELKKYIFENGHLPGVPSEEEIATAGLDLGEMQCIQMQKIEELTLHLIEMNEKMERMQGQLDKLEQENTALKAQLK